MKIVGFDERIIMLLQDGGMAMDVDGETFTYDNEELERLLSIVEFCGRLDLAEFFTDNLAEVRGNPYRWAHIMGTEVADLFYKNARDIAREVFSVA